MRLRLIRHATLQIEIAGRVLLLDPMLSPPLTFPSLTIGKTASRNPLVPLPCPVDTLLQPDAILVTHCHFDHCDRAAADLFPKQIPVMCQPSDIDRLRNLGLTQVMPIGREPLSWNELRVSRTQGAHGHGLIKRVMGNVSGFVLQSAGEPVMYVAGDTVWCAAVQTALAMHRPDIIVVNAGAAQFNLGRPITMTAQDVAKVHDAAPQAKIVAVHMETINHCRLGRAELADYLNAAGIGQFVSIPRDGDRVFVGTD
jgi:L-ascorbate metabolism protein UlaG (beta-lactamase superfamily)